MILDDDHPDDIPACGVCGHPIDTCDCIRTQAGMRPVTTIDPNLKGPLL